MFHRLFGDAIEIDFWTVALHYLCREQTRMKDPNYVVSVRACVHACMHGCVHECIQDRCTHFGFPINYIAYAVFFSQPSYHEPKIINPSEDIICPDASASTAIGAATIKHQSVEDLLGMSNSQTDGQTWDEAKAEIDKSLLKMLAPLDLCYDVIMDSKFYRVNMTHFSDVTLLLLL